MSSRTFVILVSFLSLLLVGSVGAGIYVWMDRTGANSESLIGGPYELVDQDGKTVTQDSYPGQWKLVYFGYTFCPDVCPTSLSVMTEALDGMGADADKIKPIFVSVDPERDTVEQLKAYSEHFHSSFAMLTGTKEQVRKAANGYRIYYAKAEDDSSSEYLVDHSSITYLMRPTGEFAVHFSHGVSAEVMRVGLLRALAE